ncbi:MAG: DUF3822 family protein [Chitinophagaceae bacterium]|nr:DUF3822 family protein [Chitinophagaceae bacterium]
MNASFKIQATGTLSADARLLIEVSQQGIAYIIIDNGNECVALQSQHFTNDTSLDKAANALKQLAANESILQEQFKNITVVYAYPEALLVPSDFVSDSNKKEMLELVHGDVTDAFTRADFLYRHHTHNIYTVPRQIDAVVSYLFSSPVSTHLYSLLPDMFKERGNHLYCIFSTSSFIAMLLKQGKLQAIQTFKYKTPEDVVYYLLQLCQGFEVEVDDTYVHLHGMIDVSSSLYAEMRKYFLKLQFAALPDSYTYPEDISDYPAHYFSHLFAAAACV